MENNQPQNPVYRERETPIIQTPVSVGEWMVTLLIMILPLINIIMLFVWAFSGNINISKANWAKATLIWMLIWIIFYVIILVIFGSIIAGFMRMNY